MTAEQRVTLRGILPGTVTWATIFDDGRLVVELYDHSEVAHRMLGNDVAFLLHVCAADKDDAFARLVPEAQSSSTSDRDAQLLQVVQERFRDYYEVKHWLEEQGIPFRHEFVPWA